MIIRSLYVSLLFILLSGCVSINPTYKKHVLDIPELVKEYDFAFVDNRGDTDKKHSIGSVSTSQCDYGVHRFGDEITAPDRVTYLKSEIQKELGKNLQNVKLMQYSFNFSRQRQIVKGFVEKDKSKTELQKLLLQKSMNENIKLISSNFIGCKDRPETGYYKEETTDSGNALISTIEIEIDGKQYSSRTVYPSPDDPAIEHPYLLDTDTEVSIAISRGIKDLVSKIKADY